MTLRRVVISPDSKIELKSTHEIGNNHLVYLLGGCLDTVLTMELCDSNASRDDVFDMYLNATVYNHSDPGYIGVSNISIDGVYSGNIWIGSMGDFTLLNPYVTCTYADLIQTKISPDRFVLGTNTIHMENIEIKFNANYGIINIVKYTLVDNVLTNPFLVTWVVYNGADGSDFTLTFTLDDLCNPSYYPGPDRGGD